MAWRKLKGDFPVFLEICFFLIFLILSKFYLLQDNSDVLEVEIHIELFLVLFKFIYIVSQNLIFPCQESLLDSFELSVTRGKYWR